MDLNISHPITNTFYQFTLTFLLKYQKVMNYSSIHIVEDFDKLVTLNIFMNCQTDLRDNTQKPKKDDLEKTR